jgi:hypothetical protein
MAKVKTIVKKKTHSNWNVLKGVKKGVIKLGVNTIGSVKKPFDKVTKAVSEAKQRALSVREYQEAKLLESMILQEKLDKRSEEITAYCTEHKCSRKVARSRMSKERRAAKKVDLKKVA